MAAAPDAQTEEAAAPPSGSGFGGWLLTLLSILPWPRQTESTETGGEEDWDASRGIGDWRARMQRIYDAEAAAEAAGEEDSDEEEEEADAVASVPGRASSPPTIS